MKNQKILLGILLVVILAVVVVIALKTQKPSNNPSGNNQTNTPTPTPTELPFNLEGMQPEDAKKVMPAVFFEDTTANIIFLNQASPKDNENFVQYAMRYETNKAVAANQTAIRAALVKDGWTLDKGNSTEGTSIFGGTKGNNKITVMQTRMGDKTSVDVYVIVEK